MKSLSNKILFSNLSMIIILIIMNEFWDSLSLKDSYYFLFLILIYGLSIAGIVAGYFEKKGGDKKAVIGIIGNLLLTLIIIVGLIYVAIYFTD